MKNFILTIVLLAIYSFVTAQCTGGTAVATLDVNNAVVKVGTAGNLWYNSATQSAGYGYPNESNGIQRNGIFAGSFWFGGYDDGGSLQVTAQTYQSAGQNGFWPGPATTLGIPTEQDCINWDRHFEIRQFDIQEWRADFADNGEIDNADNDRILGWPAQGNPHFESIHGFSLPEQQGGYAPFFDRNNDGLYDPMDGDHPLIYCADIAYWNVFNDKAGVSSVPDAPSAGMEYQLLTFAYANGSDAYLNSTFYELKIISQRTEPISSAHLGIWIDPDLGCETDDYVGCIPEQNFGFIYNADNIDGLDNCSCPSGTSTYCQEIPVFGVKIHKPIINELGEEIDMSSFAVYDPTSVPALGDPNIANDYYNYLSGKRKDGIPFVNSLSELTSFAYQGNPAEDNNESMCAQNTPLGDKRIVMSMGPVDMLPGSVNKMVFSVSSMMATDYPCPDITTLLSQVNSMDVGYNNSPYCPVVPPTSTNNLDNIDYNFSVYPNPMDRSCQISIDGPVSFLSGKLFNLNGQLVRENRTLESNEWNIDRGALATGMYFYQMELTNRKQISGKLVVK